MTKRIEKKDIVDYFGELDEIVDASQAMRRRRQLSSFLSDTSTHSTYLATDDGTRNAALRRYLATPLLPWSHAGTFAEAFWF